MHGLSFLVNAVAWWRPRGGLPQSLGKEVACESFVVDGFGFFEASSWMAAVAL